MNQRRFPLPLPWRGRVGTEKRRRAEPSFFFLLKIMPSATHDTQGFKKGHDGLNFIKALLVRKIFVCQDIPDF
jgi:hypothetical protein